jgi:hypothetical protein
MLKARDYSFGHLCFDKNDTRKGNAGETGAAPTAAVAVFKINFCEGGLSTTFTGYMGGLCWYL